MTGVWEPYLHSRASSFERAEGLGKGGFSSYVPFPGMMGPPEDVHQVELLLPHPQLLQPDQRKIVPRAMFVKDGRVFITEFGHLLNRLGDDFKFARNNGRAITYFYGLSAPIGTPVPSLAELTERDWELKAELQKLIEGLNEGRTLSGEAERFTFEGGRYGEHVWDQAAKAASNGVAPVRTVFAEVERLVTDLGDMVPGILIEGGSKKNRSIPHLDRGRNMRRHLEASRTMCKMPLERLAKTSWPLWAGSFAIAAGSWAAWELLRKRKASVTKHEASQAASASSTDLPSDPGRWTERAQPFPVTARHTTP